jgi:dihydrofolate synthase/folylpolyglutamate synthase
VGVVGILGDKDAEGVLAAFEPYLEHLVVTQSSTDRAMRASRLAEVAVPIYGEDRVSVVPVLADAIDAAAALAEGGSSDSLSSGAVLVTGSVVTVGEARVLLGGVK